MFIDFNIQGLSTYGTTLPLDSHVENLNSHWLPKGLALASAIRKQEYIAGRFCASMAAKNISLNLPQLHSAPSREPLWPKGILGSISHSRKMAISCVTSTDNLASVGIDAEEILSINMDLDFVEMFSIKEERTLICERDYQIGLTIVFSGKEALYKALFPIVRTFIDFKEVQMTKLDMAKQTFCLSLISQNSNLAPLPRIFEGSFQRINDTIVTVVAIKADQMKEYYARS